MSDYINYFETINYQVAVLEKESIMRAKKQIAQTKAKVGVIHYQWSMGTYKAKVKPRSKTILAVKGAYVDGVYIKNVYIKE